MTLQKSHISRAFDYVKLTRPMSWASWLIPLVFGSLLSTDANLPVVQLLLVILISGYLLGGFAYVLNQCYDLDTDRLNLDKMQSKMTSGLLIARGEIPRKNGIIYSLALLLSALTLSFVWRLEFFLLCAATSAIWTMYSVPPFRLKAVPVIDVLLNGLGSGLCYFFLGWIAFASPTVGSALVSLFFAGFFCYNHLLHVLIDYEPDKLAGISTTSVRFGRRATAKLAFLTLITISAYLVWLCSSGFVDWKCLSFLPFLIYSCYLARGFQSDLSFDSVVLTRRKQMYLGATGCLLWIALILL